MSIIFGTNLKMVRQKFGLTQKQVARKFNVSTSTIGMYEQGRREPHYDLLIKISEETKISVSELLGIENKFHIKSLSIEKTITDLIQFIKSHDKVILKGKVLNKDEIEHIVYVLKMILK